MLGHGRYQGYCFLPVSPDLFSILTSAIEFSYFSLVRSIGKACTFYLHITWQRIYPVQFPIPYFISLGDSWVDIATNCR
jgi:hypothetical protein